MSVFLATVPEIRIDNITHVDMASVRLVNRNPPNGNGGLGIADPIKFTVVSTLGSALTDLDVFVKINSEIEEQAISSFVIQTGYSGTVSNIITTNTRAVELTKTGNWPNDSEIQVRVEATNGTETLSETYTIYTIDSTVPNAIAVMVMSPGEIAVEFDEAVRAPGTLSVNALQDLRFNYLFANPSIDSLFRIRANFDQSMSFDTPYRMVTVGAEDLVGNRSSNSVFDFRTPKAKRNRTINPMIHFPSALETNAATQGISALIKDFAETAAYECDSLLPTRNLKFLSPSRMRTILYEWASPIDTGLLDDFQLKAFYTSFWELNALRGTPEGVTKAFKVIFGMDVTIELYEQPGTLPSNPLANVINQSLTPPNGFDDWFSFGDGNLTNIYRYRVLVPRLFSEDEITLANQIIQSYTSPFDFFQEFSLI